MDILRRLADLWPLAPGPDPPARCWRAFMRSTTGVGFKIMLDLGASSKRPVRFTEVPYRFRQRAAGTSKLDLNIGIEYLYLVADKLIGRWLPISFVLYCLVGAGGLALHMSILWLLFVRLGYRFENALMVAMRQMLQR